MRGGSGAIWGTTESPKQKGPPPMWERPFFGCRGRVSGRGLQLEVLPIVALACLNGQHTVLHVVA
jgi:hypothetical protein